MHWITRLKLIKDAALDATMSQAEVTQGTELAEKLSMSVLSRAWQMLLKGIHEVNNAPNTLAAADMILVRIAYAADLPSPESIIKKLKAETVGAVDTGSASSTSSASSAASVAPQPVPIASAPPPPQAPVAKMDAVEPVRMETSAMPALAQTPYDTAPVAPQPEVPSLTSFQDVVDLVGEKRDIQLKVALERSVRLVKFSPGAIDIQLGPGAPKDLANQLGRKLTEWTNERWIIAVSKEQGQQTLAEQSNAREAAKLESAAQDDLVKAALEQFPGASIVAVKDVFEMEPDMLPTDDPEAELEDDD